MRVLLVGPPADRARLQLQLARAGIEVVGEFATLSAARASVADADGIVIAVTDATGADRSERSDEELLEPLTARERQVLELLGVDCD